MEKQIRISVVIPTKNEEDCLPRVLKCLNKQTLKPIEVIVADAFSEDATRKIAKEFGCKVVDGGLPGKGRNRGARIAQGDYIFFFDADVRIDKYFLEKASKEIMKKGFKVGTSFNIPYYVKGDKGYKSSFVWFQDKCIYFFHNLGLVLANLFHSPVATGTFIFCERNLFIDSKGFDETIAIFEDSELVSRLSKRGKSGVLKSVYVKVSTRRFDKKGRFLFPLYMGLRGSLRPLLGEVRSSEYFSDSEKKIKTKK
jgi:glycosyltransferase involved in cell wall biosynthesis